MVGTGQYKDVQLMQGICQLCEMGTVKDKRNFLLERKALDVVRRAYMDRFDMIKSLT